jgi:Spy/CpxP family protein refolding chaperone
MKSKRGAVMKYKIILAIFASVLCLSTGTLVSAQSGAAASPAASAQDQPRRGDLRRGGPNLTDAQKAQLKTIRQSERSQIEALRNDSTLSREDMRAKIRAINENTRQQFLAVLTPEQQQALRNRFDGPRGFGPGGPDGPGGPGGPGALAGLGLSADQQAKLRAIHQSTKSQIDAARNDSSLTQDQREAKIKSIFDSSRQQTLAILTPEQQQKLRDGHPGGRPGGRGPRGRPGGPVGPIGPPSAPPVQP